MKKIIFILMLFLCTKINVQANNWEYLPIGNNYLDPSNYEKLEIAEYIYFLPQAPFLIKENTPYTFICPDYPFIPLVNLDISFYDSLMRRMEYEVKYVSGTDDAGHFLTSFTTPVGARYLRLGFTIMKESSMQMIENYGFVEGDEIYPFEEYLGPDRDHLPSLSTAVGYYNVNIDNPVSVEEIKNALQAFDDVDGDLSAAIEVITDNYTSKRTCPGIYEIVFRATDQSQNSTDFIVYVKVQDLTPPVITGPNYIKTSPLSPLSISDLYNQLQYSDNSNKEVDISVESNNYTNNSGYIGLYSVIFSATDLSGNKSYLEMTIDVKDEDSPVIFGPTEFYKAAHETIELSEMLAGITAYDEYCQDVTDSIRIISDGYSLNAYKPGSWPVYIEACDYYGNVANFTFYVNVHDAKGPLFLIDTNLITIVLEDDPPSLEMVLESLSEGKDFEYQTIVDEYTGNEKRPGRYRVVVRAESEMREFEINVQGEETPPKLSFWQKIGNFFRELFRKIWGIFN